jgi:hypothetical protein
MSSAADWPQTEASRIDTAFVKRFYDRVVPGIYDQFDGPQMPSDRPALCWSSTATATTRPLPGVKLAAEVARAHERPACLSGSC